MGNLPEQRTRMVGRLAELAEVLRLFEGGARVVTLTGVGGVGKTRLALETAVELRPRFRDGAWLVELSPLKSGLLLPFAIAEALPLADQTTRPMIDVLADYLAERELLLVLDTCEHLRDVCALTAQALLLAAPGLRILAASRRTLDVPGEKVFTVEPLPLPAEDDPRALEAEAAVLLMERAAEAVPGFAVTDANRADLLWLSRRLEGLPLAIELAAARLRQWTPAELTERLQDRFAVLGTDDGPVLDADPPWHQALRTAIGWSHQLCSPPERLLWARLAVFPGAFDAEAAGKVCGDAQLPDHTAVELLAALVEKSIVVWTPTGGGERYRMLDTVREYGLGWLRRLGEERDLRQQHLEYYRRMAHGADAAWMGPDQLLWRDRMLAEHDNIRAALDFCFAEEDAAAAQELTGELWFLWVACTLAREGWHYLGRALALTPAAGPADNKVLWTAGIVALALGDYETAQRLAADFRPAVAQGSDETAKSAAVYLDVGCHMWSGELARANEAGGALPPAPPSDGRYSEGWFIARVARAMVSVHIGELARAAAEAEELSAECARRGETWIRSWADNMRALAAMALGRAAEAEDHARTAIDSKRRLHDSAGIAQAVDTLAEAALATGHAERAARLLGIGEQLWQAVSVPQMGIRGLIESRRACEEQARDLIGDDAYESEFRRGYATDSDTGIAYVLKAP